MTSIYQRALGNEFQKLHPKIQERFGLSSARHCASIGTGVMDSVWRGKFYTLPFLLLGSWRSIMFPASGTKIPFRLENYAYKDTFGRETVTWIRKFHFPNRLRRFDATMIYSPQRNCIVDYLGTHQHLAVDIHLSATEKGGLKLRSGAQRFYEGPVGFSFPMLFSGYADVCEWYDDESGKFRIEVVVSNRLWGKLFGYTGNFTVEYLDVKDVPLNVKPRREELRE
jgi:hypothetical protein